MLWNPPGATQRAPDGSEAAREPAARLERVLGRGRGRAEGTAYLNGMRPEVARRLVSLSLHEAAHVVVAFVLGVPVLKVDILPDCSRNLGEAYLFPLHWTRGGLRKRLRADLTLRLAGPVANAPALSSWQKPEGDFPASRRSSRDYGARLPGGAPWTIGDLLRDARAILSRPAVRAMHEAVTAALIERWTLGGAEVHAICKRARRHHRRAERRARKTLALKETL